MANAPGIRFVESSEQILVSPADATLAAFVGTSTRGRIDLAQVVTGWGSYTEKYGGFSTSYDLSLATHDYLRNGGGSARILRVVGTGAVQSSNSAIKALDNSTSVMAARAADPGAWGNALSISFFNKAVTGGTTISTTTQVGSEIKLPITADNADSQNTGGYVLASIRDVSIGDIFAVYSGITGAIDANFKHVVVADIDAGNKQIRFVDSTAGGQTIPAGSVLKSHSRHGATTYATGEIASGANTLAVKSTDGLAEGSIVSLISVTDYKSADLKALSRTEVQSAVVDKIIGQTLYFSANITLTNGASLPASTSAKADTGVIGTPNDGRLTFTAAQAGTAGNGVVIKLVHSAAQAAPAVSVAGRVVTITTKEDSDDHTLGDIVDAVTASTAASALVSVTANALANQIVVDSGTATLTLVGGALLRVISQEFDLVIKEDGEEVENSRHNGLSSEAASTDYIGKRLGGALSAAFGFYIPTDSSSSTRLILSDLGALSGLAGIPLPVEDALLSLGVDGTAPTDVEMLGGKTPRTGLHILDEYDDIDFAAAPGFTSTFFQQGAITYTEGRGDLLWLLDMPSDKTTAEDMGVYRTAELAADTSYAALYAPYGKISDPRPSVPRGSILEVPPTPAVAGLIARRVAASGVHASAANQSPAWVGVTTNVNEAEHAALNNVGVNMIKIVRRSGLRLYGSRTLTQRADGRRFTNVRRFLNFVKQSIGASLLPMTFQPANSDLFSSIEHVVGLFLQSQWRKGALHPSDNRSMAYAVKCDAETTSSTDLSNGIVNAVLQISPTTPAEHILFRINVSTGGIRVDEQ